MTRLKLFTCDACRRRGLIFPIRDVHININKVHDLDGLDFCCKECFKRFIDEKIEDCNPEYITTETNNVK